MNRKLVNGLLLLTIGAVGCGTFTSCKDTDEDFKNEVMLGQADLKALTEDLTSRVEALEQWQTIITLWQQTEIADALKDIAKDIAQLQLQAGAYDPSKGSLQSQIDGLNATISAIKQCNCGDLATKITNIQEFLGINSDGTSSGTLSPELQTEIKAIIATQIPTIQEFDDSKLWDAIKAAQTRIQNSADSIARLYGVVGGIKNKLDSVQTDVNGVKITADAADALSKTNQAAIAGLVLSLDSIKNAVAQNRVDILLNTEAIRANKDSIEANKALIVANQAAIAANKSAIDVLREDFTGLETKFDALSDKVDALAASVAAINDRINTLPTDIILNQVHNHLFGTFNLPIGMQSNILGNYYYYANATVNFPFGNPEREVGDQSAIENLTLTPAETFTAEGSTYYLDGGSSSVNNLGQLYVSVNPNYIDFTSGTGKKMELVKSNGQVVKGVTLTSAKSDEVLNFGYSRAGEGNLYRVDAMVNPDAESINGLNVKIESGLKSSMKDILNDRSKKGIVKGLAEIAKAVVAEMDGFLPAYGIKASWESSDGTVNADNQPNKANYYIVSKYEIAATTFHPLSYEFMQGEGLDRDLLRPIGSVTEKFHEFFADFRKDIKINLGLTPVSGLNLDNISIDLSGVTFDLTNIDNIVVRIPAIPILDDKGREIGQTQVTDIVLSYDPNRGDVTMESGGSLNGLIDSISDAVNNLFKGEGEGSLSEEINAQLNHVIKDQIQGQVNSMIADINGQLTGMQANIDSQIKDILDKIEDQLAGKISAADRFTNLYEKLANRINNFFKNPNQYLQSMAAYKGADGQMHLLSTDKNQPSIFKKNGSKAAEIFLTSYTGDVIAPAFKKYIAFTDNAAANRANSGFDKVLSGRQRAVALDVASMQPGRYEIVYSALDYRGKTSTRLYYINVTE